MVAKMRSKKEIDDMHGRVWSALMDAQDSGSMKWVHYYENVIEALEWVLGEDVDLVQVR